jgi:uncharacterized membrane protein YphA (DoxX/SURF4 family)
MNTVILILQIAAALGLLNVWLIRFHRSTPYRGGNAGSMREEFAIYGLPGWFAHVIGTMKVGAALCLIAGLWLRWLVFPSALLLAILMLGALAMHAKIRDPLRKSAPALVMLALSVGICLGSMP